MIKQSLRIFTSKLKEIFDHSKLHTPLLSNKKGEKKTYYSDHYLFISNPNARKIQ